MITLKNSSSPFEFLQKIGSYLIGISILCYISGFVITNLYLGSLGIVNLEILEARYILSGIMFFLFIGLITYLLYGLIQTLRKYRQKSTKFILSKVLWYSFNSFSVLLLIVVLLTILPGSVSSPPVGLPQISPAISWSAWLQAESVTMFRMSLFLIGSATIFILVVSIIVSIGIHTNKDTSRIPKIQLIIHIAKEALITIKKTLGPLFGLFVFFILLTIIDNALRFIKSNDTNHLSESIKTIPSGDWGRFLMAIILIYGFLSLILIWFFLATRSTTEKPNDDTPLTMTSSFIVTIVFVLLLILPTYALGVYPSIPQQIGGGQIVKVEANISNLDINNDFSNIGIDIFIIDRTTNSTIFLLVDNPNQEHKIIELKNDQILSITYNP